MFAFALGIGWRITDMKIETTIGNGVDKRGGVAGDDGSPRNKKVRDTHRKGE